LFLETHGWHERLVMSFGLSKSFGALGGVVASLDPQMLAAVEVTGGPMVFGGPIPPASLGAGVASADIHLSDELPVLQAELLEKIRFVNEYAAEIGLPLFDTDMTPLWYVQIGPTNTTVSIVARVLKAGYYVNVAVYPVVQKGKSGLRFTVTRYHNRDQIRGLLDSINEARLHYQHGEDVIDLAAFE
jgi:7-keto-8-aminopelargonate synthetase-like enzyme